MRLNVQNETAQLQTVVLGRAESNGANPTLDQTFDAKSYETVKNNDYPKEEDLIAEMSEFEQVLKKYNVEVLRPTLIEDCNQVFSRDVGFVIEDEFFIANIIPDRLEELQAYREIKRQFKGNKINYYVYFKNFSKNRPYLIDEAKELKKNLGSNIKIHFTQNPRIIHERKIFIENLCITFDNSFQNITTTEPTWTIIVEYSEETKNDWLKKASSFKYFYC